MTLYSSPSQSAGSRSLHSYEGCQEGGSHSLSVLLNRTMVVRSAADAERRHARERLD